MVLAGWGVGGWVIGSDGTGRVRLELLEERRMLSVSAVVDNRVLGGVLVVRGTEGVDVIRVRAGTALAGTRLVTVESAGQAVGTFDGVSSVRVEGLGGNDQLIAAPDLGRQVTLDGGDGDDTLVASSGVATLIGGEGTDALWAGRKTKLTTEGGSEVERKRGVNRLPEVFSRINVPLATPGNLTVGTGSVGGAGGVGGVLGDASDAVTNAWKETKKLAGKAVKSVRETLREPTLTKAALGTLDFTGKPLFSDQGPTLADISQGSLNNCYIMATLAGTAAVDPSVIRQTVTDLGDGTYAVRIMRGKSPVYYRVDADLPLKAGTTQTLAYADLGKADSLWVALVEKAFALDRGGSYKRLDKGGWMADVFKALGMGAKTVGVGAALAAGPAGLMTVIAGQLVAGKVLTLGTKGVLGDEVGLVENHAYVIESVIRDESGVPTGLRLRNPWNWDGPGGDGVVEIDARAAARAFSGLAVGTV